MSDQKRFLDKDYTRRQFLKLSGKSLVGVAHVQRHALNPGRNCRRFG